MFEIFSWFIHETKKMLKLLLGRSSVYTLIKPESLSSFTLLKKHCFQFRPKDLGAPWGPWGPWSPRTPGSPLLPVGPAGPGGPGSPLGPCFPRDPSSPLFPLGPVGPSGPWLPVGPAGPGLPGIPGIPGAEQQPLWAHDPNEVCWLWSIKCISWYSHY